MAADGPITELAYLRPGQELPAGWRLGPSLEGCYHGQFATHIIIRDATGDKPVAFCPYGCGVPLRTEQYHGSYKTMCCHNVLESCCEGS